jgi:ADP-ribose pyrophosphatase
VAVGAVVFHRNAVLLVRRGQSPSLDSWAIPGGRVEIGETLQQAAEREIREETGVTIKAGDPIFTFDVIDRDQHGQIRYHYVIVDLLAEYVRGDPQAADDARDARWIAPEKLKQIPINATTLKLLQRRFGFGATLEL